MLISFTLTLLWIKVNKMEKTTLVIHPKDASTDFLARIYANKDWDVIRAWYKDQASLKRFMDRYDRIIMMGHGTPSGLLNTGTFYKDWQPYVIDNFFVDLLQKKETISIWCYSDQFARQYKLPGFHTGMIISEVHEAQYVLGETPLTAEETLDNMILFADAVGRHIDDPDLLEMQRSIRKEYNRDDPVSVFNRKNIIMLDVNGKNLVEE